MAENPVKRQPSQSKVKRKKKKRTTIRFLQLQKSVLFIPLLHVRQTQLEDKISKLKVILEVNDTLKNLLPTVILNYIIKESKLKRECNQILTTLHL